MISNRQRLLENFSYQRFAEAMIVDGLAAVALERAKQRARFEGKTDHDNLIVTISQETQAIVDHITKNLPQGS